MRYLDSSNLSQLGYDWPKLAQTITEAVECLHKQDAVQPIKPYLRFKDSTNRIISMPAYVGGDFDIAGLKWIASFPGNTHAGIPRAHSVTILNDANTGQPIALFNTALISVIRTVSVSAMFIDHYLQNINLKNPKIGIAGFGPIGQYHLKMVLSYFPNANVQIYDLKEIDGGMIDQFENVDYVDSWQEAYEDSDIFITCTVSNHRYIDMEPKSKSLHLNVSLRDYKPELIKYFKDGIVVDKWEEICRENTDIEAMHTQYSLEKEMTYSIEDVVVGNCLKDIAGKNTVMFNPMGMSIFDIAIGKYFYDRALDEGQGVDLSKINHKEFNMIH